VLLNADVDTQQVTLTGFDLSMGIQSTFSAQIKKGGTLTLPAKLFGDIVSRLTEGNLTLEEKDEFQVTIKSASCKYQIRGLSADEYPELPTIDGESLNLPAQELTDGLASTLFAVSTEELKGVITGVHWIAANDELEFCATSGHVLSTVTSPINPVEESNGFEVTLPAKAAQELKRMLDANSEDFVAVRGDDGQLVFEWQNQRLTTRLLEGQYPNYRQLIPKQFSRQMTSDRKALISALERVAVLSNTKTAIVKFNLSSADQQLTVSVNTQDVGSGAEVLSVQYSGDDLEIAFNARYLAEGLKVMNTTEVQMNFNTSTSPVVVNPLGGGKMTYLTMPIQLRE
jgi:DNA polymerase III subunit beta